MNSKIFFNGIIREIYMVFYEANCKCFRKRVLLSRKRNRLCSLYGEREGRSEEDKRDKYYG